MPLADFYRALSDGYLILAYIASIGVILAVASWRKPSSAASVSIGYLLASAFFIGLNRAAVYQYDLPANIDEAQMAANAMRARFGWLNWDLVDPVTSGPLNSLVLGWPYLFGADITLYSARLTAAIIAWSCGLFIFLAARRIAGAASAILASFPVFLFFGSTTYHEFVHYSSEHLPILLICGSLYFFVLSFYHHGVIPLIVSAILLGAVPYAKLQGAPIAALLGIWILARAVQTDQATTRPRWGMVIAASLLPTMIFLGPLALVGELDYFFRSYFSQFYFRWERLDHGAWHLRPWDMLVYYFPIFALLAATATAAGISVLAYVGAGRPRLQAVQDWLLPLALAIIPVTYFSVAAPGQKYAHYLLFWIPTVAVWSVSTLSLWPSLPFSRPLALGSRAALFAVVATMIGSTGYYPQGDWLLNSAFLSGKPLEAPRSLQWLRPAGGDTLLCWGWQPDCYLSAAIKPATRYITNENQLYQTGLAPYFRDRFMEEINARRPDFIVDGITPDSFHFNDVSRHSLSAMSYFKNILDAEYALASSAALRERCPRVYVRRERMQALNESRIAFSRIRASAAADGSDAQALDDGSVDEKCQDYWITPDGRKGTVELIFEKPTRVKTVLLLNTRNGLLGDRATGTVAVTLMRGKAVARRTEIAMRRFPYWTIVSFDSAVEDVDAAHISILSFEGLGGGLNEVKLYRD